MILAEQKITNKKSFQQDKRDPHHLSLTDYVRKWGGLTSDALLDPSCEIFTTNGIEGFIGYRMTANCAIAFGDPVCSVENTFDLAKAFIQNCRDQNKKVIFITTSESFAKLALKQSLCKAFIEFGEELIIDPHLSPMERQGTHASLVRRKVRHARKENTIVSEYHTPNEKLENDIEQVGISWLKARRGPQVHISNVHLFKHRLGKRWFYAQQNDRPVGVVVLNQLQASQGWLLNHLMFTPDAPHGTPELLVVSALETLKTEGCHFVTFGAVPSDELHEIEGLGKWSSWIIRNIYKSVNKIFHLNGHKKFWEKFHPESRPSFLLFSEPSFGWNEIRSLIKAMNVSLTNS